MSAGANSQFDIPENEEGRIQSSGHKDETCIEESPEMKDISRVNKMMEKQNEKASKTHVSSNTTKPAVKKKAKRKPLEYKPSTGLFGWFWRLLDPK